MRTLAGAVRGIAGVRVLPRSRRRPATPRRPTMAAQARNGPPAPGVSLFGGGGAPRRVQRSSRPSARASPRRPRRCRARARQRPRQNGNHQDGQRGQRGSDHGEHDRDACGADGAPADDVLLLPAQSSAHDRSLSSQDRCSESLSTITTSQLERPWTALVRTGRPPVIRGRCRCRGAASRLSRPCCCRASARKRATGSPVTAMFRLSAERDGRFRRGRPSRRGGARDGRLDIAVPQSGPVAPGSALTNVVHAHIPQARPTLRWTRLLVPRRRTPCPSRSTRPPRRRRLPRRRRRRSGSCSRPSADDCLRQREVALAETTTSMPDPVAGAAPRTWRDHPEIDAALDRIAAGTYGLCVHCGPPSPGAAGVPAVRSGCVSCQRRACRSPRRAAPHPRVIRCPDTYRSDPG